MFWKPRRKVDQGVATMTAQSPMPAQVACAVPVESSEVSETNMKYEMSDESNLGEERVDMGDGITERDDNVICLGNAHTISCKFERLENGHTHAPFKERNPETELCNQAVQSDVMHSVEKSDVEKMVFVDKPLDKLKSKPTKFVKPVRKSQRDEISDQDFECFHPDPNEGVEGKWGDYVM